MIRVLIALVLLQFSVIEFSVAQGKQNVTLRNDSVYLDDVFQFHVQQRESPGRGTMVQLRAPDSSLQALLIFVPQDDKLRFSGRFATLNKMYDCFYPKMELLTLYESYIRNKVFVNGIAKEAGLKAYCAERKMELVDIPRREVKKPTAAQQDSILKANSEAKMKAMVQIEIWNNAKRPVTVIAGRPGPLVNGKPRGYAEKREEAIPAGQRKIFTAFTGEQICLIGPDHLEKDCHAVNHLMKKLIIEPEGDRFGK